MRRCGGFRRFGFALLVGALTVVFAPVASATAAQPDRTRAVIEWHMTALTRDDNGDGVVDQYLDGNRTADIPADGRYRVVLDGCSSTGATRFEWFVGDRHVKSTTCRSSVRLPEGDYNAWLRVSGPSGAAVAQKRISVVTHIVLGLGDSYGSGAGAAVVADSPGTAGYYDPTCHRTPRSHQAQAALELERSDRHSAVIFVHLSCAGAQVSPGLLSPFLGNRPQVDQARDLLAGQPADAVLLSIGGNDVGFGAFLQQCLLTPGIDCPTQPFAGFPTLHSYFMSTFDALRNGTTADPLQGLPALARCLGSVGCTTTETPDGSGKPLDVTPANVVYSTYPDLTKGDDAAYCRVVPGTVDPGLLNTNSEEWRWTDQVLQALANEDEFVYTDSSGGHTTLAQTQPGLNAIIAETQARFGWSPVNGVFSGSTSHGYCASDYQPATDTGRWTLRFTDLPEPGGVQVPVHPNQGGQQHYTREVVKVLDPLLD